MDEVKPGSSNLPPAPPGGESPAQAPQPAAPPSMPKPVPTQPVSPPPAPAPPPPATQPTTPPTQPLAPAPKKPISKVLLIIAILLILILSSIAVAGGVYLYQLSSGVELISIPDSLKNLIPFF